MQANFIRIKNSSSFLFFYKKERKSSAFQLYRHYWIFIGISLHFSGTFLCTAAVLDMKTKNNDDLPFDSIIVVIIIKMSSQSRVTAADCTISFKQSRRRRGDRSSEIYFKVAFWFPGNVRVKPHCLNKRKRPLHSEVTRKTQVQMTSFAK